MINLPPGRVSFAGRVSQSFFQILAREGDGVKRGVGEDKVKTRLTTIAGTLMAVLVTAIHAMKPAKF